MKFAFAASGGAFDKLLIEELIVDVRLVSYADPGLTRSLTYVSKQRGIGNRIAPSRKRESRKVKHK